MNKLRLLNGLFPPFAVLTIAMVPTVVHFTVPEPLGPDKVFTTYAKQALEEFGGSDFYNVDGNVSGICGVPRESGPGNYEKIARYLTERVQTILGDDLDGQVRVVTGTYEGEPEGDLLFDVKASPGCENWKPIILQDHMDMVLDGTAAAKEIARLHGIAPYIDGHTMYSVNHETSLGADNGMGISIMLTVLKNRDSFKHGPIRVICTSDEETTTGGAKIIETQQDVLFKKDGKQINHMINIDAEPRFGIYRSCAGLFDITTKKEDFVPQEIGSDEEWKTYDLWIGNLNGGHSAWDMENYRANADRLAFEYLNELNNGEEHIKIISYDHTGTVPKSNQIIKNGHLVFAVDLQTIGDITTTKEKCISEWKDYYKGDDFENRVQFSITPTKTSAKCLDVTNSAKIIKYLGSNKAHSLEPTVLQNGLCYGILAMTQDDSPRPVASTNIGPVTIESDNQHVYFSCVSKTRLIEKNLIDSISGAYAKAWREQFGEDATIGNIMNPWVPRPDNILLKWMEEAYTNVNVKPNPIDTRGGVEPALWTQYNPDLHCICIGPEIQNAHSTSEICYLDTVDPCIRALMKVLSQMEKA